MIQKNNRNDVTTKFVIAVIIIATVFSSCGPTAEEIMKRYETYQSTLSDPEVNKAGFSVSAMSGEGTIFVNFSNPELNTSEEYLNVMAGRLYVADAEKPNEPLPVKMGSSTQIITQVTGERTVTNGLSVWFDEKVKVAFLIVGFKGIDKSESKKLNTPPMFFLIDRKTNNNLTPMPLLADSLFDVDYEKTRFPVYRATLQHFTGHLPNSTRLYNIRIGNTGRDDRGYITVDFLSEEIQEKDWVRREYGVRIDPLGLYRHLISPLFTEIKVGNKSFYSQGYAIENGVGFKDVYNTKEMPDTIIVWSMEWNGHVLDPKYKLGAKLVFDGKTKEVIE